MSRTYIYSLESEKLVRDAGVRDAMEVFTQLAEETNPEHKTELIDSLMSAGYYSPMLSVKNDMGHMMSGEQTADVLSLVGKTATFRSDDQFSFTKQMLDRPFWKVQENTIMVSDGASILIGKDGMIHELEKTHDMENVIHEDFPNGEASYFISMRGTTFSSNYEEAKTLDLGDSMKNVPEILEESDRKSRIAITALAINTTLGLDDGTKGRPAPNVKDVINTFSMIDDDYIEEYKDQVGMGMVSGSETMKKIWKGIDSAQQLTKEFHHHSKHNPDYAKNVVTKKISEELDVTKTLKESTVINSINSIDINKEQGTKKRHFKGRSMSPSF